MVLSQSEIEPVIVKVLEPYIPFLKEEREEVPVVEIREGTEQIFAKQEKDYSFSIKKGKETGNYYVRIAVSKDLEEKWGELEKLKEKLGGKILPTIKEELMEVREIYNQYLKAPPEEKKVMEKKVLDKIVEVAKEMKKKHKKEISIYTSLREKCVKSLTKISRKLKKKIYKVLDTYLRNDLLTSKKPEIILLGEGEAASYIVTLLKAGIEADAEQLNIDYTTALQKKKIGSKKALATVLAGIGAVALAAYYVYRRILFFEHLADQAAANIHHTMQEIEAYNQAIEQYQEQLGGEYKGLAGKIRLIAETMAGQHEEIVEKANQLMDEAQPILDQDGDGKIDSYIDANGDGKPDVVDSHGNIIGDGTGDNDLDNDGEPDVDPATGDIIDRDIWIDNINRGAYAALMKELGFDLIPEDEKLYMKYLVGLSEQVRSQDLSSYNQSNLDPAVDSIAGYKDQVSQHITDIQTLNQNIEETQNQIEQLQQEIAQLTAQKESYLARAAQYGKYLTGTVYLEGALGILTGAIAKFKGTSTLPYLIVKAGGVRVARAQ